MPWDPSVCWRFTQLRKFLFWFFSFFFLSFHFAIFVRTISSWPNICFRLNAFIPDHLPFAYFGPQQSLRPTQVSAMKPKLVCPAMASSCNWLLDCNFSRYGLHLTKSTLETILSVLCFISGFCIWCHSLNIIGSFTEFKNLCKEINFFGSVQEAA